MTLKMIILQEMKSTKARVAACAAALLCSSMLCFLCGCGNEDAPKPGDAANWSEDPTFKKGLEEQRVQAVEIGKRRAAVAKRMNEMTAIMKEKLATDDEKKVAEELEKNAEWRSLKEKASAIDAEFEKKRKEMLSHVRQQMNKENFSK